MAFYWKFTRSGRISASYISLIIKLNRRGQAPVCIYGEFRLARGAGPDKGSGVKDGAGVCMAMREYGIIITTTQTNLKES